MTQTRRYDNDPASVPAARRFATDALAGLDPAAVAVAELLVSELASNCVRHTDSAYEISISHDAEQLRIAATDWGGGEPVKRAADPLAISGRGLAIIDTMASAWGVERLASPEPGKTVWFTMSVSPGADLPASGCAVGASPAGA